MAPLRSTAVRLGRRENVPQFLLLVAVNALVGGMIGQDGVSQGPTWSTTVIMRIDLVGPARRP